MPLASSETSFVSKGSIYGIINRKDNGFRQRQGTRSSLCRYTTAKDKELRKPSKASSFTKRSLLPDFEILSGPCSSFNSRTLYSLVIQCLAIMLTPLEMTIISALAGMGFLMAVFGILLALVSLLWIGARVGNADGIAGLL